MSGCQPGHIHVAGLGLRPRVDPVPLSRKTCTSWGWPVPFFVGLLIGPVGPYLRAKLDETEESLQGGKEHAPLKVLVVHHYGRLLAGAAVIGVASLSGYTILYMQQFAVKNLGIPATAGFFGGGVAGLIVLVELPFLGHLAARDGTVKVMMYATIGALLLAWPLFRLMVSTPTVPEMVIVVGLLGVIMAFYFGPKPTLPSFLFAAAIRGTGLAVTHDVGVTLLGGIAPFVRKRY